MLVLPQTVTMKWHGMNRKWFISKGYKFTKIRDVFEVSVLDLMKGSDAFVKLECDNCKDLFERRYYQYINSVTKEGNVFCKSCAKKLTGYKYHEVEQIFKNNECTLVTKQYSNNYDPLEFICKCGRTDIKTLKSYLKSGKCRYCNREELANSLRLTFVYVNTLFTENNYILLEDTYSGNDQKLKYQCPNGHINSMTFHHFQNGKRCPECHFNKMSEKFRHDYYYVQAIFEEKGCKLISKEYINSQTPLEYLCGCGKISWSTLANFTKIHGCTYCGVKSKGELKIKEILETTLNIKYLAQYGFDDCRKLHKLNFDFAIFNEDDKLLYLIEYDGEHHYSPVDFAGKGKEWAEEKFKENREKDIIKNNYCIKNNIKLIRIPFWEYENIESILYHYLIEPIDNFNGSFLVQ
ncbi:hypothetical protein AB0Y20_01585 [Heyndrickxia oleronia]|uniref:hypothetical protein n=1 Tax=Heyndrickxia oleronia TaxID=38875 RepID=UPI003F229815